MDAMRDFCTRVLGMHGEPRVLLCAYTCFVDSWVWICVVGVLLLAAPFIIDF
jgi:hypothetical protein